MNLTYLNFILECSCNKVGSTNITCSAGKCECKPQYTGVKCDQCAAGYYRENSTNVTETCKGNGLLIIGFLIIVL